MELWQLKTFRVIAETLNFTKAAETLNLTQSAVSHQIKALESELGEPLFIRAKRGVILTAAGKIALDYAVRILDEAQEMKETVAGREAALTGRVRVAAATQALVFLFSPIFESFMQENEGVELLFRTTVSTEQTVNDVLNGTADIGFASMPTYSPTLSVVGVFEDELVLVTGTNHRLARGRKVTTAELRKEKWIIFERGSSIRRTTDKFFAKVGLEPEKALESNDTYFIKLMIQKGVGVSLLPAWAINEEVKAGRLAQTRLGSVELKRSISMVTLKGFQPAPTRKFISYILSQKEQLNELAAGITRQ
jgi:DNA-binding transcriptional LysR family regulator